MASIRKLKKAGATMERAAGNPNASKKAKAIGVKAAAVQSKGFAPGANKKDSKAAGAVTKGQVASYDKNAKKGK
jgi:hypothetical protein